MVGDRVGPLKRNRRERPRGVVQGEAQVVRPDAPRAHRAGLPHAEARRRIARTARLEVTDQLLQLAAHETQRQLEVDPLGGHQVVGAQKLARDGEKRNTERVVALPADGEARGHGVTAVFLEMRSEEHTSELQSRLHLVCRLLLEKKKKRQSTTYAGVEEVAMCLRRLNQDA